MDKRTITSATTTSAMIFGTLVMGVVLMIGLLGLLGLQQQDSTDAFQEYCRSRLYEMRDAAVAEKDTETAFKQWVITFTEYVDQCVEKR